MNNSKSYKKITSSFQLYVIVIVLISKIDALRPSIIGVMLNGKKKCLKRNFFTSYIAKILILSLFTSRLERSLVKKKKTFSDVLHCSFPVN